jgi:hypothetical protein
MSLNAGPLTRSALGDRSESASDTPRCGSARLRRPRGLVYGGCVLVAPTRNLGDLHLPPEGRGFGDGLPATVPASIASYEVAKRCLYPTSACSSSELAIFSTMSTRSSV